MHLVKFPSIGHFRDVIAKISRQYEYDGQDENDNPVYVATKPKPTVVFEGTVKLNGTNGAVVRHNGEQWYQSRERVLTREYDEDNAIIDNHGFALAMDGIPSKHWDATFDSIERVAPSNGEFPVVIFGEWCGLGVVKRNASAISKIPTKIFVVVKIKVNNIWLSKSQVTDVVLPRSYNVRSAYDVSTYSVPVDFDNPKLTEDLLVSLTNSVDNECPFALLYGIIGPGEGIVWCPVVDDHRFNHSDYWFKVKGDKHAVTHRHVKSLAEIELMATTREFAEAVVTENRLMQGIQVMTEQGVVISKTNTAFFLRWIYNDCLKEEMDTIVESGLVIKDLGPALSRIAQPWYFKYLTEENL